MAEIRDIEVVVFDVLGTLVDEPSGLRAAIRKAVPASDEETVDQLLTAWQQHVESEQQRMEQGHREYANTQVIDLEAAQLVAEPRRDSPIRRPSRSWLRRVSGCPRGTTRLLASSGWRSTSRWSVSPTPAASALTRLNAYAGLRWHQALSGEAALAYKPAPEVYQLAIDTAGCAPERVLMVAAHAWDLRGAQAIGMRTAYVHRPVGDPPTTSDAFDGRFNGLNELVTALTGR